MTTRLRVATSGKFAAASDIASNAAVGRVVRCAPGAVGEPDTVVFSDAIESAASVPNLTALVALNPVGFGQKLRVESVGRSYEFTPVGVSPLEPMVVLAGIGGDWHALEGTSDQRWQNQPLWYVDAVAGNDESDGSAVAPLQSLAEFRRRIAGTTNVPMVLRVLSSIGEGVAVTLRRTSLDASLTIMNGSVPVVLAAGVLATYAAPSTAANEVTVISVAGIADFTPYVNKRITFGVQGVSRIAAANPSGMGVQFARITTPKTDTGFGTPGTGVPVIGQNVQVEELGPDLPNVAFFFEGIHGSATGAVPTNRPGIILKGLQFSRSLTLGSGGSPRASSAPAYRVFDCDVSDLAVAGCEALVYASSLRFIGKFSIEARVLSCLLKALPGDLTTAYPRLNPGGSPLLDCVSQKVQLFFYEAATNVAQIAVFDCTGDGIQVHNGASLYVNTWLIGKGNTGAGLSCSGVTTVILSGAVCAITGVAGQIKAPNGAYIAAANIPRQWDHGSEEITLGVGGVGSVVVPALPADARIVGIVRKTQVGGVGTSLTYSIVGTTITVTSNDATERSVLIVSWLSPASRVGGITY